VGNHVATNIKNFCSTVFTLHRVTEHLVTDFACCLYLYGEFACFRFLTFVHQTLIDVQEIVKFIKFFSFLSFSLSSF